MILLGVIFLDEIKKTIYMIYRKSAGLNLYSSICSVKKERILKELKEIKTYIEKVEKSLK